MPVYEAPEVPFEVSARALVAMGPEYARVLVAGKKGASDVVWISPKGHAVLGERLRARGRRDG